MLRSVKSQFDRTQEQVTGLKPLRSPGMLTSKTTRGVMRRAKFQPGIGASSSSVKPRWG